MPVGIGYGGDKWSDDASNGDGMPDQCDLEEMVNPAYPDARTRVIAEMAHEDETPEMKEYRLEVERKARGFNIRVENKQAEMIANRRQFRIDLEMAKGTSRNLFGDND